MARKSKKKILSSEEKKRIKEEEKYRLKRRRKIEKKEHQASILRKILTISLASVILLLAFLNVRAEQLERSSKSIPTPTPSSLPTPTSIPKPAVRGEYDIPIPTPTPDPDPIITCNIHANCGGGSRQMKRSECNQTICCQIEGNWYFYLSKEKCLQDQAAWANYHKRNYYVPNYDFPTYTYTPAPLPTYQPLPTPTPDYSYLELEREYQKWLEEEHQKKCQKIVDDWWSFKKDWYATRYNNYSSSAEAIMDLSRYMAKTEELLRNEGCSNRISLYEGNP